MRILLVLKESNLHERLGVMHLGAALKQHGHEVRLHLAYPGGPERAREVLRQFSPSVVGYSMMTGEHRELIALARALKKEGDFLTVFGGPHPTFEGEASLDQGADAVGRGEADLAFPEFCRRVDNGENWWESPNFLARHGDRVFANPLSPLIEDLDSLPFADRDLMYAADRNLREEGHKTFLSARGCPYRCTYCFNSRYNALYAGKGPVMRYRSPASLVEEIARVKECFPLRAVFFNDDNFILKPPGWVPEFSRRYRDRIALPFTCNVRANLVTDEKISLLRDAGLDTVDFGIECADEEIAGKLLRRDLTNDQIRKACVVFRKYRLKFMTANLLGIPGPDSYRTDLKTLDFNIELKPIFAWSSILYPYPGTPFGEHAAAEGLLPAGDWYLETNKRSSIFPFSGPQEKRRIENLHKLFGLMTEFPFLRRHADFLCGLPLSGPYTALYYFWYGYNYKFRIWPFHSPWKEIWKYLGFWLRLLSKN